MTPSAVALLAVVGPLGVAITATLYRVGTLMGRIDERLGDLERRIGDLEDGKWGRGFQGQRRP